MLLWSLMSALAAEPEPVHVQIDWQGHPAMHIPWPMFGRGLTDRSLNHRRWRHQFRQTVSEPALRASGVRLFVAAAMAAERARNPEQARRLILEQLAYVEAFVAEHPDRYALARTPAEARELLATTDKLVFVHSIEGGHELLWDDGDPAFWAEQGVALFTLIHLRDDELGGAAILDLAAGPIINPKGARARRKGERRGLTALGESAMVGLDRAGILVDLTHMAPEAVEDALRVAAAHRIPPLFTHSKLASIHDDEFGLTDAQVVETYRLGGLVSLGLNAFRLGPLDPTVQVPSDVCWDTVEAFAWHHDQVQQTIRAHVGEILEGLDWEDLDEEARIHLATGWSSDWNGWVSHSRGTRGCREQSQELDLDRRGLAHPGLLPEHWQRVEEQGVDLDPMLRSAERFLQLWEQVRSR